MVEMGQFISTGVVGYVAVDLFWERCGRNVAIDLYWDGMVRYGCRTLLGTMLKRMTLYISTGDGMVGYGAVCITGDGVVG